MESLTDKIAELINPAPKSSGQDEEGFGAEICIDKHDGSYGDISLSDRSQLRVKNFQPSLDKRYVGQKVSRRKFMNWSNKSDDEVASDDFENDYEYTSRAKDSLSSETSEHCTGSDEDSSSEDKEVAGNVESHTFLEKSSNDDSEHSDEDSSDEDEDSIIRKFSSIDVDEELKKGKAVKAQLSLWDRLLENRIKLQKLLMISNRFPQNDDWKQFSKGGNNDLKELVNKGYKSIKLLLDLLIELQTELLQRNNETNCIVYSKNYSVKENSDDEIQSDTEDEDDDLKEKEDGVRQSVKRKLSDEEYGDFLTKRHKSFITFRNGTIQKWNDKIKIASGKLSQNSFSAFDQSTLKQIEQILSDKPRLIKRTQLKRSIYRILGTTEESKELESFDNGVVEESKELESFDNGVVEKDVLPVEKDYDPEIFDDNDFYHQLLRELIQRKTVDTNDSIALSRQWLEIQKQRTKMKKNVDTKASKARKVRYDVIPKLVNFMASIDHQITADETINELCHSLFKDGHQSILYT